MFLAGLKQRVRTELRFLVKSTPTFSGIGTARKLQMVLAVTQVRTLGK